MKTTVQALKELYATLGGNLADVALIERIPEMIEALNSIAVAVPAPTAEDEGKVMTVGEDGALGYADALPPVTAEDAGKVLAVNEQGAWNPAEASGGGLQIDFDIWMPSDASWANTHATVLAHGTSDVIDPASLETNKVYYAMFGRNSGLAGSKNTGAILAFEYVSNKLIFTGPMVITTTTKAFFVERFAIKHFAGAWLVDDANCVYWTMAKPQ